MRAAAGFVHKTRPVGPTHDIGAYEVLPGDADGDSHVDVSDLLILANAFGSSSGDPAYNADCDFNADGSVDVSDLLLLSGYWGT